MTRAKGNEPAGMKRLPTGQFAPGTAAGPGRPALPAEFKAKGPDALKRIVELMASGDDAIALKASTYVADRIYGKAHVDETAPTADRLSLLVAALQATPLKDDA